MVIQNFMLHLLDCSEACPNVVQDGSLDGFQRKKIGSLVAQELCPGCGLPASGDTAPHGHLAGEMHALPATEVPHARARARLEEILAYAECYLSRK